MKSRFSSKFSSAALIASLALGSAFAVAQPAGPGMQGARMGAHGGHGHAGKGEEHFAKRMEALKSKLNLNPTQEAQFSAAQAATRTAMDAGRDARMKARDTARAELQKADPDLAMLLTQRESLRDANATQRKAAINEWSKFLGLLTTEQKAVVKSQLLNRMQRMGGTGS